MSSWIDLGAVWRIVVVGLLAGAGLPALFAVGLRLLAAPGGGAGPGAASGTGSASGAGSGAARAVGTGAAGLCFAAVLAGIGWGIFTIVNGG
ncbi:hypothetical protein BIV57_18525 [Mangrovactinospora gilvigrisea]|uniref:Uncharacterized protein n=1 Tax=Mangrovactinospora gilvigrisea TaxID=1428644 RepID=A0A1J7BRE3_9ACTN|nr:hypothetical protein [Mangrovactinospora gilvigrisea]OIV36017.1 hypothetical protein BIV57_18525 [Mangrovactinospora gilvigrisea]